LKILIVIPYFYPAEFFGGPVKIAFDLGKELVRRGNEVFIYTSDALDLNNRVLKKEIEIEGMHVHYFKNLSMFSVKTSKLFLTPEMYKQLNLDLSSLDSFDIIHVHEYSTYQNIIVRQLAKKYGVPYVLQAHGSLPIIGREGRRWIFDAFFGHRLLKDSARVIALNRMEVDQYSLAGVPYEKIALVPNGIDLSQFVDLPNRGCFRKKFGLDENKRILLFLGRLNKIKGLDTLATAFKQVVEESKNVLLVIAGPDDGYLNSLKNLVCSLKINDNVLLVGPLYGDDKLAAYVDADVYVLPSTYETFPVSILEAYACSKPVIASKVGSLNDLVLDGVTGLLVEPGSADKLARSVVSLLNDPKKGKEMGLNGRRLVYESYNTGRVADLLENIYKTIVCS
jgi:glycosyltransferase involved in cell wall biosynthesis